MRVIVPRLLLVATAMLVATAAHARSFIVVAQGNKLPAQFSSDIAAAGGQVVRMHPEVGLAIVESSQAQFSKRAAAIKGVAEVLPDLTWQATPIVAPESIALEDGEAEADSHTSVAGDPWAGAQWNLDAINVAGAWSAGHFGSGVRVAVLDSGIASGHIDLAPNLNTALSTSFVPGEAYNFTGNGFNHGTHVAGIIGAAMNTVGTVGVAPQVELVAVKVLSAVTGRGSFGGIISGLLYSAQIEADVVNMSLGASFPRSGYISNNGTPNDPSDDFKVTAAELTSLINAINRATTYAAQRGCTIVVSAGNSAIDRDHDGSFWVVPADATHVLAVSATGPIGWAKAPATTFLDNLASYSNYGQSRIDFAAPGGDFIYPFNDSITVVGINRPVWVWDMVFAPSNRIGTSNRYGWSAGTSMAAPHVAAVAALIIGKNGGSMRPSAVIAALRASADDLGKPGNDDAYGAGRVNAGKAVK
jgi:lantibiotic leader peptide-processing serine protease